MALKGDRITVKQSIAFFMNQVAERGGLVTLVTGGSGVAMDQTAAAVQYSTSSSGVGRVIGVLMNDVVNYDLTRQHANFHRDEVQLGGKVTLLQNGTITTNWTSGITGNPAGQTAYLGNYGRFTNSLQGNSQTPAVGFFESNPDENGYVKISISV